MGFWQKCLCFVSIPTCVIAERHCLPSWRFLCEYRKGYIQTIFSLCELDCTRVPWTSGLPPAVLEAPFSSPLVSPAATPSSRFRAHFSVTSGNPGVCLVLRQQSACPSHGALPHTLGPPARTTETPEGEMVRGVEAVDCVEFYLF